MKKLIPDELLPLRYRGKGYRISIDCHIYGVKGHQLKENTECEYGLNPPKILGRNLWWLYAKVFYEPVEGWTKVILNEHGYPEWCSDEDYYAAVEKHQGYKPRKVPLTQKQKDYIVAHHKGMQKTLIAGILGVSRMTVHRYIKELNV